MNHNLRHYASFLQQCREEVALAQSHYRQWKGSLCASICKEGAEGFELWSRSKDEAVLIYLPECRMSGLSLSGPWHCWALIRLHLCAGLRQHLLSALNCPPCQPAHYNSHRAISGSRVVKRTPRAPGNYCFSLALSHSCNSFVPNPSELPHCLHRQLLS